MSTISKSKPKYIFVTGGVASSLGKGIISASLAKLLQARGYEVTIQKLDPYINIDPGTLNPYEHGECYVTEDGAETDRKTSAAVAVKSYAFIPQAFQLCLHNVTSYTS